MEARNKESREAKASTDKAREGRKWGKDIKKWNKYTVSAPSLALFSVIPTVKSLAKQKIAERSTDTKMHWDEIEPLLSQYSTDTIQG